MTGTANEADQTGPAAPPVPLPPPGHESKVQQESFQMTPTRKDEEDDEDLQAVSSETRLLVNGPTKGSTSQLNVDEQAEAKLKAAAETSLHVGEAVISTSLLPEKRLHSTSLTSLASITVELCGKNTNLTRNQIVVLCLLSIYFFTVSCYFSLVAPFLPGKAKERGLNQTQIGVIFSIYQVFLFIGSPLFGKYLERIGVRFLFVYGLLISSISQIAFGFVDRFQDSLTYFLVALLCRSISGLGSSMGYSYALAGYYFPNKISSVMALLETANGIGIMIGPLVGGILYELGGFQLPFFAIGGFLLIVFVVAYFQFPDIKKSSNAVDMTVAKKSEEEELKKRNKFYELIFFPKFLMILLIVMCVSLSLGFLGASLQTHLKPLNLRPIKLGLVMFAAPLFYVLVSPIVGILCDKFKAIKPYVLGFSGIACAFSLTFLGPAPFYNLPLNIWIFMSGLIAFGIFISGSIIPTYAELTTIAMHRGFDNDIKLQGLLSGVFNSFWSLGALLGPLISGLGLDQIGFAYSCLIITAAFALTGSLFLFIHFIVPRFKCNAKSLDSES